MRGVQNVSDLSQTPPSLPSSLAGQLSELSESSIGTGEYLCTVWDQKTWVFLTAASPSLQDEGVQVLNQRGSCPLPVQAWLVPLLPVSIHPSHAQQADPHSSLTTVWRSRRGLGGGK